MRRVLAGLAISLLMGTSSALAQTEADFFKGKALTAISPSAPGGGYDLYTRVLVRHMADFIPGKPTYIAQNMTGAGGIKQANYIFNVAPKDGTVFGLMNQGIGHFQLFRTEGGIEYDIGKFTWLGRVAPTNTIIVVWHNAPVKSLADMKKVETIFGADGRSSQTYMIPTAMRTLLGYNTRVILGFQGAADVYLAMERGEVHARTGDIQTVTASHPEWVANGQVRIMTQLGSDNDPATQGVPSLLADIQDPDVAKTLEFIASYQVFGYPFAAPPGLPPQRSAILRRAFDDTMKSPAFLAEAEKLKMVVAPLNGEALQSEVEKIANTEPAIIERARKALE